MTNEEKIQILNRRLDNYNEGMDKKSELLFLRNICEFRLRKIIEKYEIGIELDDIEIESLKRYFELANVVSIPSHESYEDIKYRANFGSGVFTDEEIAILESINELYNGNTRARR